MDLPIMLVKNKQGKKRDGCGREVRCSTVCNSLQPAQMTLLLLGGLSGSVSIEGCLGLITVPGVECMMGKILLHLKDSCLCGPQSYLPRFVAVSLGINL